MFIPTLSTLPPPPSPRSSQTEALSTRLRELGLGAERHILVLGPGARHNESAWAARLPAAVEFLCSSWRA